MRYFAVLVEPWGVYVKDWSFFCSQGGRRQRWGKHWKKMRARSIEDARMRGERRAIDTTVHKERT